MDNPLDWLAKNNPIEDVTKNLPPLNIFGNQNGGGDQANASSPPPSSTSNDNWIGDIFNSSEKALGNAGNYLGNVAKAATTWNAPPDFNNLGKVQQQIAYTP